ncbi:MAG: PAS domain S-box protein, partial [Anaerolineae bacterium]
MFPVEVTLTRVELSGVPRLIAVVRDISERKLIEELSEKMEREVAPCLNVIPIPVWKSRPEGSREFFNNAWLAFTGRSLTDETGDGWLEGVHPDDRDRIGRELHAKWQSRESCEVTYRLRRYDGEYRLMMERCRPFFDYTGRFRGYIGICVDLTDLHETKAELAAQRTFFEAIVDTVDALIVVLDREWRIHAFNRACQRLTGYSFAEVKGRSLQETFIVPEEMKMVTKRFQQLLDGECPVRGENHWRTKSGELRLISWSNTSIMDAAGNVEYVIGTGIDVTEKRLLERELQREHEYLSVTLRSIGDGVIATDKAGRVVLMNEVAQRLTGWSEREAQRLPLEQVFRIISEDTGGPIENPVDRVIAEGKVIGLANHTALVTRSGEVRSIADSAAPIRDSYGEIQGIVLVFRDVTEERKKERELRESEQRFRMLAENAMDIVYRLRFKPEQKFEYVSPSSTRIVGYTPEEHYSDPYLGERIVHPDDRPLLNRARSDPSLFRKPLILRWIHKDGRVVWTEHHIRPVLVDGQIVAIEGISRDITERKEAEQRLEFLSFHDQLTGLYNRRFFEREISRRRKISDYPIFVITADIDGLKLINDTMGHAKGDTLLVAFGRILKSCFRGSDVVARIGGDEFAAILLNTYKSDGERLMQRI